MVLSLQGLYFFASLRRLLIALANSLDHDQTRKHVCPDVDPNWNSDGFFDRIS